MEKVQFQVESNKNKILRESLPVIENDDAKMRKVLESFLLIASQKRINRWSQYDWSDEELAKMKENLMAHVGTMATYKVIIQENELFDGGAIDNLDWAKVEKMVLVHDISETIFGDLIRKTAKEKELENQSEQAIRDFAKQLGMDSWFDEVLDEYSQEQEDGSKISPEANFVKSLDEMEGIVHTMAVGRVDRQSKSEEELAAFFERYARDFPGIQRLSKYIKDLLVEMKRDPAWSYHAGQEEMFEPAEMR